MPGDPRRAQKIANDFIDDAVQVSDVRGIQCFTGTYEGTPMSVMASGMGLPSLSIYATELYRFYGVKRIIRVGTCGAMSPNVRVRDVIVGRAHQRQSVADGAGGHAGAGAGPVPPAGRRTWPTRGVRFLGPVFASDHFWQQPRQHGRPHQAQTLAVEMSRRPVRGRAG